MTITEMEAFGAIDYLLTLGRHESEDRVGRERCRTDDAERSPRGARDRIVNRQRSERSSDVALGGVGPGP